MADLMDYGRYTPHNVTGGALGGGMAAENPGAGFMQGYGFVRNQQRQDEADEQGRKRDALQDQILQSKVDDISNQRQSNVLRAMAADMERDPVNWMKGYSEDELSKAFANVGSNPDLAHLATPEGRAQYRAGVNKIHASMPNDQNGGQFDIQGITDGLNMALPGQINKGTDVNGRTDFQGKKIVGFAPAPDGHRFYMLVQTTDVNGNPDVGPVTEKRTADPNDKVKAFSLEEVMGTLRRNSAAVNYLDSQQARLGDAEAIKRTTARSDHARVLDTINSNIDPNLQGAERQAAITREGYRAGLNPSEASTLASNMAVDNKDKALDDANKGYVVFDHYVKNIYGDPRYAAQLAETLKTSSPILSGQLSKISQIQDVNQYNQAVDDLREKAMGLHERATMNMPHFHNMPTGDGGEQPFSQTPRQALGGVPPQSVEGFNKPPKPAVDPIKARDKVQQIDKELYMLEKGDTSEAMAKIMADPKMKATVEGNKQLQAVLNSGDKEARDQYYQTLKEQRAMYSEYAARGQSNKPAQAGSAAPPKGKIKAFRNKETGQVIVPR
jgi:hypothetical protein